MGIIMVDIMQRFHRTYDEYMNTPPGVIDLILKKDEIDNKLKQ